MRSSPRARWRWSVRPAARRSRPSARCSPRRGWRSSPARRRNSTLTTSGANTTFFRVVAPDAVQGPQDANYIVKKLKPKAVLIIDDEEAYSTGLVAVMTPDPHQGAGSRSTTRATTATTPGATLHSDFSSLVNSQLNSSETVVILPWQSGAERGAVRPDDAAAGQDGDAVRHRRHGLPGSSRSPAAYVVELRAGHLDGEVRAATRRSSRASRSTAPTARSAYRPMRRPTSRCARSRRCARPARRRAARTCSPRSARRTSPPRQNPLGIKIAFKADGDLEGRRVLPVQDQRQGHVRPDLDQVA